MLAVTALAFAFDCGVLAHADEIQNPKSKIQNGYADALRAIDDGIPEVGIEKLWQYLATDPPPDKRAFATLKLAQALIAAGRADEALKTVGALPDGENAERDFVKAQAFTELGRWADAYPLYHLLSVHDDSRVAVAAKLGEAECLNAMNRTPDAIRVLESLKDPSVSARLRLASFYIEANQIEKCASMLAAITPVTNFEAKWKHYVEGRLKLARHQTSEAVETFTRVAKDPRGLPESLLVGAQLGMARALAAASGPESADNILEDYISQHPGSGYLEILFRQLDQLYEKEENPSNSELQKWAQADKSPRAALAAFYLAKGDLRDKKTERGLQRFTDFVRDYPEHPYTAQAAIIQGKLLLDAGNISEALQAFETAMRKSPDTEFLAEAEIAAGTAHFKQREFVLAAGLFQSASQHSEKQWQVAIFNSALAWLNQGNEEKFLENYKELSTRFPESSFRRDLLLEEGLLRARSGDPRAKDSLTLFVKDFPDHALVPDVRIALAELSFAASRFPEAASYLQAANDGARSGETSERAEYLAIFMADAAEHRDDEKVIQACLKFIREREGSTLLPEVRMKLGQIYFRREDFANAQTQFEFLATESPSSPLTETALFLAGRSAMRSMNPGGLDRALELFEQVAKLDGPLKLYARQEQAVTKTRLGKETEAIVLYDNILSSKPDAELKFASLCGKGENFLALGSKDPKAFDQAIAVFEKLAAQPDVTASWRNKALYKKAKCLENSDRKAEALAAYYDVLQPQAATDAEPEYFWYYKAGFDAARILEAQEQWKSAIGIYEKIANLEGPRAAEAKSRADQLRLEHFIWDE